jgi:hypothetical protein
MALLWMEGFEGFANVTDVRKRYSTDGTGGLSIVTGRNTGLTRNSALKHTSSFSAFYHRVVMGSDSFVFGAAINWSASLQNLDIVIFATGTNAEQLVLKTNISGELLIDRATTNLGSTTGLGLISGQWYYIEVVATMTDGATGSVEVWVNGVKEIDLSSVQTRNVSGENINIIELFGGSGQPQFDDCYFLDTTGTDQTTRIGDPIIETVIPDANGTTNDFTASPAVSNYLNVDEATTDDDTTYNHSSTATHKELYGMSALEGNVGTIYAVMPRSNVRKVDAGTRLIKNVARSSATEVDGTEYSVGANYAFRDHIYENDPNGGGAWTESSVNAAEFGIKITS